MVRPKALYLVHSVNDIRLNKTVAVLAIACCERGFLKANETRSMTPPIHYGMIPHSRRYLVARRPMSPDEPDNSVRTY